RAGAHALRQHLHAQLRRVVVDPQPRVRRYRGQAQVGERAGAEHLHRPGQGVSEGRAVGAEARAHLDLTDEAGEVRRAPLDGQWADHVRNGPGCEAAGDRAGPPEQIDAAAARPRIGGRRHVGADHGRAGGPGPGGGGPQRGEDLDKALPHALDDLGALPLHALHPGLGDQPGGLRGRPPQVSDLLLVGEAEPVHE
ncbi:MAG: hypothetical protein ACK559_06805, partial [bacterium]